MIFVFLCLTDLVWSSLGPSMLLQMTLFHSLYGWVIVHCIHVPRLLHPFLHQWTFRLLPCALKPAGYNQTWPCQSWHPLVPAFPTTGTGLRQACNLHLLPSSCMSSSEQEIQLYSRLPKFPWTQLLTGGPTGLRFYFSILLSSFIYKQ